jgi:hypothetical protein
MASIQTIARLHSVNNLCARAHAQPAPVTQPEAPTLMDLYQRSLMAPVRRRFGSPRGALNSPAIQSTMHAPTAMDQSDAFASMAARGRAAVAMNAAVTRWQARQAQRGVGHQPWMRIQI